MPKKIFAIAFLVAIAGCADTNGGGNSSAVGDDEQNSQSRDGSHGYSPPPLENRDWQIEGVQMDVPGRIILSVANDGAINADLVRIEDGKKVVYESEIGAIEGARGRLKEPLSKNAKVLAQFTNFSIKTGAGGKPFVQTASARYALRPLAPPEKAKP